MKIYALSGLGADARVFQYLKLPSEIIPIEWVHPQRAENLSEYAARLIPQIKVKQEFILLGVSFGGLIALELSKILKPKATILISSFDDPAILPSLYRLLGRSKLLKWMPTALFKPPISIAYHLFNAENKELLRQIIQDTDKEFAKWALINLMKWANKQAISPLLKINGNKDRLIPAASDSVIIKDGGHFMVVDKAQEISLLIKDFLIKLSNEP